MTMKERVAVLEAKVETLYERVISLEHPARPAPPKPNSFADGPRS
ncbi:hypothetical protein ES703_38579 [subsurface metagenome]